MLEIPSRCWEITARDLFSLHNKCYLVTVNYYSDFWELDHLSDISSATLTECTKAHCAWYEIPGKVISDNDSQFHSQDYEAFAKAWVFIHLTSSQYHSHSKGKAKAAV